MTHISLKLNTVKTFEIQREEEKANWKFKFNRQSETLIRVW